LSIFIEYNHAKDIKLSIYPRPFVKKSFGLLQATAGAVEEAGGSSGTWSFLACFSAIKENQHELSDGLLME
jgi:hypothetical protein